MVIQIWKQDKNVRGKFMQRKTNVLAVVRTQR